MASKKLYVVVEGREIRIFMRWEVEKMLSVSVYSDPWFMLVSITLLLEPNIQFQYESQLKSQSQSQSSNQISNLVQFQVCLTIAYSY